MYIALIFNDLKQHLSWKLSYLDNEKEMLHGNFMRFCPKFTKIGPVTILFSVRILTKFANYLSKGLCDVNQNGIQRKKSFDGKHSF